MGRLLAIALLVSGCAPLSTAPPQATPTAAPVTSSTADTTPNPASQPVPVPASASAPAATPAPAACGDRTAGQLPAGWLCVELARHDMDGDGWPDVFVILVDARALGAGEGDEWRARVVLTNGKQYEVPFAAEPTDGYAMIRGFVDADGDGRDDALVQLGRGASTETVGVFGVGRNGLAQASYQDGTKARLLFAGSVRHGAGVECLSQSGRAELVLRGISNYKADDQWDWDETVYTWSSKVLILSSQRAGTIKVAHPFDPPPNEDAFWSFRCFGLDLY